jgi:hypothetical protein
LSRLRSTDDAVAIALIGAAVLAALSLKSVPWKKGFAPATPFDNSAPFLSPGYALLRDSAAAIPPGASVVTRAEPPDAGFESHYYRLGLALLPGRRVLPSAYFDMFTAPEVWREADYRIVVGKRPPPSEDALVLETPEGTVWKRKKP